MRRHMPALVLALSTVLPSSAAAQDADDAPPPYVTLTYRVTIERAETSEDVERRTPLVPRTETTTVVTLGPRVVGVAPQGGRRVLLDYGTGWAHEIDDDAGTYRRLPLIAHFGFQEIEMFNRRKLARVLSAAGVGDPAFAPVERSILFGWPDPDDDADIASATSDDGVTTWRLGDDELARWAPSEHELDDAQRAAFDRFLQRHCRLHWETREAIAAETRAPALLRFRWHNTGERATATWELVSCSRGTEAPAGVEGLTRAFPDTAAGRLARRVLQPGDDVPERLSAEDLARLSAEAHAAGRPEDAALLLLESGLQDGADVVPAMRELLTDPDDAKAIRALMGSVSRANSEPEKGVAELDAVDRSRLTHPAILDVFRANGLANMGRTDDAVAAFESALRELPWLAAAYNDLGMVLHRAFRTEQAWLAWEAGRSIAPDHPTWQGVQGLEQHLRDTYGELL